MLVADGKGDYAFLSLKGPAFDLTDRGVAGRSVTAGLDAFVYAERGVYRTGETVHLTTLLRDAKGVAVTGVPMTLVVERPGRRRVSPHRGAGPGRRRALALVPDDLARRRPAPIGCAPIPIRRARRSARPASWSKTTCRIAWSSIWPRRPASCRRTQPAEVTVDGRFLYGAPASNLDLEGEMKISGADERPGLPRLPVRRQRRRGGGQERADHARGPARRPTTTARPSSPSRSTSCRRPRVRSKRRSPCGWSSPAAARSSAT